MASRELRVSFVSDTKSLERGFDRAQSRTQKFASIAKTAGLAAGGVLAVGITKSVKAAQEAEKSQARMEAQLKASGISFRSHADQIETVIQKHSRLSGLDDEQLQDAFTNIVRVTGDVSKSLNLTGLAADFARAKHIDVAKAGEIVAKVAGGNIGILSRYGIQIDKGASSTEALGILQQKFAGQAKAYGDTTAGAQDKFRVAVENLQEKLGAKLLPVITRVANAASKFITEMNTGRGAGGRFAEKMSEVADKVGAVLRVVRSVAGWLKDHPALLAAAGAAWVAYKVAAVAQIAIVRASALGLFGPAMRTRMAASAGTAGATTGRAFALKAGAVAAAGVAGWQLGKWLRDKSGAVKSAGDAIGRQFGEAFFGGTRLNEKVDDAIAKLRRLQEAGREVARNIERRETTTGIRGGNEGGGRRGDRGTRAPSRDVPARAGAARGWRPSFAQQVAESDVLVAQTGFQIGGVTPLKDEYTAALRKRSRLLQKRLHSVRARMKQLRAFLRRPQKAATRRKRAQELLRLTQEESALVAEVNAIAGTITDLAQEGSAEAAPEAAPEGGAEAAAVPDVGGIEGPVAEPTTTDTSAADLAAALKSLEDELKRNRDFAQTVVNTQNDAMARWIANVLSGVQGQNLAARRLTPSIGTARAA